jgi:hypothetical protein
MRAYRFCFAGCLLFALTANAQDFHGEQGARHPFSISDWARQTLSIGEGRASVKVPPDWSIQNDVLVFSGAEKSDCKIDLAPARRINFDQRLTRALDEDRRRATGDIHAELYHHGGTDGVRVVSVHYVDQTGRSIAKRYFDLSSQDGEAIMEWAVDASPTPDGSECVARFNAMMANLGLLSPAAKSQTEPSN